MTTERVDIPLNLDLRAALASIREVNRNLKTIQQASSQINQMIGTTQQAAGMQVISGNASTAAASVNAVAAASANTATAQAVMNAQAAENVMAYQALGVVLTDTTENLRDVAHQSTVVTTAISETAKAMAGIGGNPVTAARNLKDEVGLLSGKAYEAGFNLYYTAAALDTVAAAAQKLSKIPLPEWLLKLTHAAYDVSDRLFWGTGYIDNFAATGTLAASKIVLLGVAIKSLFKFLTPLIGLFRTVMAATMALGNTMYILSAVATTMANGLMVLLYPLVLLKNMILLALAPFYLLYKGIVLVVKAAWVLIKPVLTLYWWWKQLTLQLYAAKLTMAMLGYIIGLMSPKLKLLVLTLSALGVSTRVVVGVLGVAINVLSSFGFLLRGATLAIRMILNPTQAFKDAVKLAATSVLWLSRTLIRLTAAASSAAMAMLRLVGSQTRAALASANQSIGEMITGMFRLRGGLIGMASLSIAAFSGWGVTLAAQAETAHIPYQTLLGDMHQAKKLLGEIESFAATTPFQTTDLQEVGRKLLMAGVPAANLTDQMRVLGDIASGTQKPIGEYADIFLKVQKYGRASLEEIGQLARKGVPIFDTLSTVTGTSGEQLKKMISDGKVGFAELQKALLLTTQAVDAVNNSAGAGVFLGATVKNSQTLAGLWSTMKDNIGFLARDFGMQLVSVVGLKSQMENIITVLQNWRTKVADIRPVIVMLHSMFLTLGKTVKTMFAQMGAAAGIVGNDIVAEIVEALAIVQWAIEQTPAIFQHAGTKIAYYFVVAANTIIYWFKDAIPAVITGMLTMMLVSFGDFSNLTKTVFKNLAVNIKNAMFAIWQFIKSGGTASLRIAWTPLLTGFKETVSQLPEIPERAVGRIESALSDVIAEQQERIADSHAKALTTSSEMIRRVRKETAAAKAQEAADIQNATLSTTAKGSEPEGQTVATTERKSFAMEAIESGSAEALKAIFGAQNQDKTPQKQLNALQQIAKNTAPKPAAQMMVQGAVT